MGSARATIKDVALAAGVSTQTVSRVVNGHESVLPATRRRVETAIAELRYRPSAVARGLQSSRTNTIGVLLWGTQYYGPAQTFTGIVDECARRGLSVLISELPEIDSFDPDRALTVLLEHRVDGIIMSVPHGDGTAARITDALADRDLPLIFVRVGTPPDFSGVEVDNRAAMRSIVDHLVDQGCTHIAHIAGPNGWDEAAARTEGWRTAAADHGLDTRDSLVIAGDWSPGSGARAADELVDRHPELDAIVAANDRMAIGAIRTLTRRGLRVPEDLAVTGFDDIPEAAWVTPALTSIAQPLLAIGNQAVTMLLSRIEDPTQPTAVIAVRAGLVVRESSQRRDTAVPADADPADGPRGRVVPLRAPATST